MGLTSKSMGMHALDNPFTIVKSQPDDIIIALAGNPNVGKSTVFNSLTGLNQHTGNWAGKTVTNAHGVFKKNSRNYILVDLPGAYSIFPHSAEEEVARDFICFGNPDAILIVCDATCLERNLNLVFQIIEVTPCVMLCINFMDEAKKKQIDINLPLLEQLLKIPVVSSSARNRSGLTDLTNQLVNFSASPRASYENPHILYPEPIETAIKIISSGLEHSFLSNINKRWIALKLLDYDDSLWNGITRHLHLNPLDDVSLLAACNEARKHIEQAGYTKESLRDELIRSIVKKSEQVYQQVVTQNTSSSCQRQKSLDKLLTNRVSGIPIMLSLLCLVFYLTITGANYPSKLLSSLLFGLESHLSKWFRYAGITEWIRGPLIDGAYRVLAWVVSVMLPPMAIFFPLFTLLEDFGYLPRVAFNLDHIFKKSCTCGKQCLSMWIVAICYTVSLTSLLINL
ncbi:FeoB small GTPase domain-containing protein [Anaeromicropila populeti]|uniref:Ferrous iron transport protein B n=1 Tax=Anaeromicropila populeti TaxID=37658 RepID=A0A1I6KR09_9FIRM|nr:FeoB small GTPase domain-containing protein [Anaeromicropila populeti]SFR93631.1 Ferrous iron transport protein B [Anaeromicropila populeti]